MRRALVVAGVSLLAFAASAPVSTSAQRGLGFHVLAHPSCGVRELDAAELESIFTASMREWPNGRRIVPFNYAPESELRKGFDRQILSMSPREVSRFWINQRIRGGARPPRQVSDPRLMARVIARLPGSIGYVPEGRIPPGTRLVARVYGGRVLGP
jgi:hypothetical protein